MNDTLLECETVGKTFGLKTEALKKQVEMIRSAPFRCCVTGGAGSGKTSVIRMLLDTECPLTVNAFSRSIACEISYAEKNYAELNGSNVPLATLSDIKRGESPVLIHLNNEFLRTASLTVAEIQESSKQLQTTDEYEWFSHIGVMDYCILVIDAYSPVSKYDLSLVNYARRCHIPTYVLVSKADRLEEEDREKVIAYIRDMIAESHTVTVCATVGVEALKEAVQMIQNKILQSGGAVPTARKKLVDVCCRAFMDEAKKYGYKKLAELKNQKKNIASVLQQKRLKLFECMSDWDDVLRMLINSGKETEEAIEEHIKKRETFMMDDLLQMLKKASDAKAFWETDVKIYVDRTYRTEADRLSSLLFKNLDQILRKLQTLLRPRVKGLSVDFPAFECDASESKSVSVRSVDNLQDLKKLKMGARVISAVALFGTGLAITTIPVSGVMMAISTLLGLGTELLIDRQTNTMKKELERRLPDVVQSISTELSLYVHETLQREMTKLVDMFHDMRDEWKANAEKAMEDDAKAAENLCDRDIAKLESALSTLQ